LVRAPIKRQRGGMLVAAICTLVVVGMMVFASYAMNQSQRALDLDTVLEPRLDRVEAALAQFVALHKRLPCPAQAANPGREATSGAACNPANQTNGLVPWMDLGLPEADTLDPWLGRISYRVSPAMASSVLTLMNMSWCDSAGNKTTSSGASMACSAPCSGTACTHPSNYLYGKGLQVQNASAAWLNQPAPAWDGQVTTLPVATGAAYVLVSHGPNGIGENSNGIAQPLTGATIFIDDARTSTFDDVLRHPTISTVLARASLGARTPH
jgi:hypothetical protein